MDSNLYKSRTSALQIRIWKAKPGKAFNYLFKAIRKTGKVRVSDQNYGQTHTQTFYFFKSKVILHISVKGIDGKRIDLYIRNCLYHSCIFFLTAKSLHSNLNVCTFHFSYLSLDLDKSKIQYILLVKNSMPQRQVIL